ncbi:Uncharacterized protein APZ42_008966 [Daphnia magna]|uniref:Uncharacterized protein n=1 Tax=Daphnia magna TaxID=35525 RepID=A0A162CZJ3_9CRUS|nr:Uncharacterized protein APZ42_008966 [Daphnia magna]
MYITTDVRHGRREHQLMLHPEDSPPADVSTGGCYYLWMLLPVDAPTGGCFIRCKLPSRSI